jgi:dCMP deaminase
MNRLSWDEYFLNIAKAVAERSTCPSRKVGAVLVNPETNSILTTGYNGSARGTEHCPEHGTASPLCIAIHAELNILTNAALNGVSTNGATLYLTCSPCEQCSPNIINCGIDRIVCSELYRDTGGVSYLDSCGMFVEIPKLRILIT